jgi:hypothetical protein
MRLTHKAIVAWVFPVCHLLSVAVDGGQKFSRDYANAPESRREFTSVFGHLHFHGGQIFAREAPHFARLQCFDFCDKSLSFSFDVVQITKE